MSYHRGGEAIMDPLKMHSAGVKKPLADKYERIQDLPNQQARYYPTNAKGDVDEWAAINRHKLEVYQREKAEEQIQKNLGKRDYHKELDEAVRAKQMKKEQENAHKRLEGEYMQNNINQKLQKDALALQ